MGKTIRQMVKAANKEQTSDTTPLGVVQRSFQSGPTVKSVLLRDLEERHHALVMTQRALVEMRADVEMAELELAERVAKFAEVERFVKARVQGDEDDLPAMEFRADADIRSEYLRRVRNSMNGHHAEARELLARDEAAEF